MREIIKKFFMCIDTANFDGLAEVMTEDAKVFLPNTREVFENRSNYIRFNKEYPGRWHVKVEKIIEADHQAVAVAEITNQEISFYATMFFKIEGNMIIENEEYYSENSDAPEWRLDKGYCIKY